MIIAMRPTTKVQSPANLNPLDRIILTHFHESYGLHALGRPDHQMVLMMSAALSVSLRRFGRPLNTAVSDPKERVGGAGDFGRLTKSFQ